jgi:homospermidine synthase
MQLFFTKFLSVPDPFFPVCADNIGCLMIAKGGKRAWWTGSLMKATEAQRVSGLTNNGANITVSAACLATISWAMANPNRGMLFPDDLSHVESEQILTLCEPFLGELVSCAVPPDLLPPLNQPFVETNLGVLPPV